MLMRMGEILGNVPINQWGCFTVRTQRYSFERISIVSEPMKKRQGDIEHSDYQSQTSLDVWPESVMKPLEVAHDGH